MNDNNSNGTFSLTTDLQVLHHEILKYNKNPMIGYLNINSLRNKLTDLKVILKYLSLNYFILSEKKLDEIFPNSPFTLDCYEIRARRDRNKFGGGLLEYLRNGLICKRTAKSEPKSNECICSEITFSKKKWVIFGIYRPPYVENLTNFFEEMTTSPTKVTSNYENNIVMGDFNIDIRCKGVGLNNLSTFCDLFHLTNIEKSDTCFTKTHTSLIDLILTNKPSSFNTTLVTETGLSDYHKMITTFFKLHFSRLRPKVITYRNYKKFHEEKFLNDLKETNIIMNEKDPNQNYQSLTKTFLTIVNKHAPLKKKIVRGNQAPFMTKEFQKAIYTRSRLKNKMNKNPTEKNIRAYKRQRNLCVSLRRKNIKSFLNNVTKMGIITNKNFWTFIKPFLTNKGFLENKDITLIEGNKIITSERQLAKIFNEHYLNIVEKSSGIKPKDISQCDKNQNIHKTGRLSNPMKTILVYCK